MSGSCPWSSGGCMCVGTGVGVWGAEVKGNPGALKASLLASLFAWRGSFAGGCKADPHLNAGHPCVALSKSPI